MRRLWRGRRRLLPSRGQVNGEDAASENNDNRDTGEPRSP
jgi:hypothetical protein